MNNFDISNLIKKFWLKQKTCNIANIPGLKAEQDKYVKLETWILIQVIVMVNFFWFFGDDGFQNMFVYQTTFNMLKWKEDNDTEYVIGWESKGLSASKLLSSSSAFYPNIKYFRYKNRNTSQ